MISAFRIHHDDNVATLLQDLTAGGAVTVVGAGADVELHSVEPISLGHKIATAAIPTGSPVVKFGVIVGKSTRDIAAGQWVHLHNCSSNFDERSQSLDVHSGATTDTRYE